MSMPPHSSGPDDDGIPAADPGAGAPPPASGFGIGGEEPDVVPGGDPAPEEAEAVKLPEATAFRTPDPRQIGPDGA